MQLPLIVREASFNYCSVHLLLFKSEIRQMLDIQKVLLGVNNMHSKLF